MAASHATGIKACRRSGQCIGDFKPRRAGRFLSSLDSLPHTGREAFPGYIQSPSRWSPPIGLGVLIHRSPPPVRISTTGFACNTHAADGQANCVTQRLRCYEQNRIPASASMRMACRLFGPGFSIATPGTSAGLTFLQRETRHFARKAVWLGAGSRASARIAGSRLAQKGPTLGILGSIHDRQNICISGARGAI